MGKLIKDSRPLGRKVKQIKPEQLKKVGVAFALVIAAAILYAVYLQPHTQEVKVRHQLESTQHQLIEERNANAASKVQTEQQKAKLDEIQKKLDETTKQLQAKRDAATAVAEAPAVVSAPLAVSTPKPVAYAAPTGSAKAFIYQKESGNRPGAINPSSGACGLGQALPCAKMGCSLVDYACQDAYFTNYMLGRYGTWENAQAFWLAHSWW